MTNINILAKHYDKFTPNERLNLAIAAAARNDQEELQKLFISCPRLGYRQSDVKFVDKYDSLILISSFVCGRLEALVDKTALTSLSLTFLYDLRELRKNNERKIKDENIIALLEKLHTESLANIKAIIKAYKLLLQEAGIKAEIASDLLNSILVLLDADILRLAEFTAIDEQKLKTNISLLRQLWDKA